MSDAGGEHPTVERFGRQMRTFPVAVSVGAMAGAWARQENAPAGSAVVVDHEISALGRIGRPWEAPPERTLALGIVLRPRLVPEVADVTWLVAGLGVIVGSSSVSGAKLSASWPDGVVDAETSTLVAATKVEIQLGPGEVRAAIATVRIDLAALGLDEPARREELLEAVLLAIDEAAAGLADGTEATAAAYEGHCGLIGKRMKLRLLPSGETRGTARGIDHGGGLELASGTGMVQRITVDMLRDLVVV